MNMFVVIMCANIAVVAWYCIARVMGWVSDDVPAFAILLWGIIVVFVGVIIGRKEKEQ